MRTWVGMVAGPYTEKLKVTRALVSQELPGSKGIVHYTCPCESLRHGSETPSAYDVIPALFELPLHTEH